MADRVSKTCEHPRRRRLPPIHPLNLGRRGNKIWEDEEIGEKGEIKISNKISIVKVIK